jgi:hypothetical protein
MGDRGDLPPGWETSPDRGHSDGGWGERHAEYKDRNGTTGCRGAGRSPRGGVVIEQQPLVVARRRVRTA